MHRSCRVQETDRHFRNGLAHFRPNFAGTVDLQDTPLPRIKIIRPNLMRSNRPSSAPDDLGTMVVCAQCQAREVSVGELSLLSFSNKRKRYDWRSLHHLAAARQLKSHGMRHITALVSTFVVGRVDRTVRRANTQGKWPCAG